MTIIHKSITLSLFYQLAKIHTQLNFVNKTDKFRSLNALRTAMPYKNWYSDRKIIHFQLFKLNH